MVKMKFEAYGPSLKTEGDKLFINSRLKSNQPMAIDPRTKLFLAILAGIVIFVTRRTETLIALIILIAVLISVSGRAINALQLLIASGGFWLADGLIPGGTGNKLIMIVMTMLFVFWRFLVLGMMGVYIENTTSVTELIQALEKLWIPRQLTLPLAVAVRFMPTIREEYAYLKDTMKIRNIEVSLKGFLFHPVRTMELALVPLLIRSLKIADELSAAAMVRGIDRPGVRTALRQLKLDWKDGLMMLIGATLACGLILWDLRLR